MSKRISMKDLRNAIKHVVEENDTTTTLKWNGLSIQVRKYITPEEVRGMVNTAVRVCFDDDGSHTPENLDPAIRFGVVGLYTNLTMFSDVSENYNLVYKTDIYPSICKLVDANQLEVIINAINSKIDEITKARATIVLDKVNEIYSITENLQQQFANLFSGVDAEGLSRFVSNMAGQNIDEGKLVRAIMEQKNGSDEQ